VYPSACPDFVVGLSIVLTKSLRRSRVLRNGAQGTTRGIATQRTQNSGYAILEYEDTECYQRGIQTHRVLPVAI
jgi:hypothetical protein